MIAGQYFVTPHAVRQFQYRIAPLPYNEAMAVIIKAINDAGADRYAVIQNGVALRITISQPFRFRAIINHGEGANLAVTTILGSGLQRINQNRLRKYEESKNATKSD